MQPPVAAPGTSRHFRYHRGLNPEFHVPAAGIMKETTGIGFIVFKDIHSFTNVLTIHSFRMMMMMMMMMR